MRVGSDSLKLIKFIQIAGFRFLFPLSLRISYIRFWKGEEPVYAGGKNLKFYVAQR